MIDVVVVTRTGRLTDEMAIRVYRTLHSCDMLTRDKKVQYRFYFAARNVSVALGTTCRVHTITSDCTLKVPKT